MGAGWDAFSTWPRGRQITLALVVIIGAAIVLFVDVPSLHTLRAWSQHFGPWFPVVFFFLYIGITQFPIPRTLLTLSSGILFGPLIGCIIALSATTVSATISLMGVRFIIGDRIRARLTHPAVTTIDARLRARGWLAVASLRMIAAVPFSVLNYTAAMTSVRVVPFALATLVGSAPGTIATVILGDALVGRPNPVMLAITAGLFCLGMLGLFIDSKLPTPTTNVKSEN
ncbi:TVP38/TMEM64 family protein [Corynebacterium aquilae]|uniref:TVP38/TMEM64 family membrane protein n=1 Tax=Corynebacterium aquilae DSM 44791 TaxID=1431546 RepID=A0A1L7CG07_9CORY|nr:hypothetical protein CAQU_06510 [Corynebacterium aquilae DSM 44791]